MLRSELVLALASETPHLTRREVERVVAVILDGVSSALERGARVELRGFGAFSVRSRPARSARNPRTGAPVQVAAKTAPFFRAGKELRRRLNTT